MKMNSFELTDVPKGFAKKFDRLLDLEKITSEPARKGSEPLKNLDAELKYAIIVGLGTAGVTTEDVEQLIVENCVDYKVYGITQSDVIAALRRLQFVGSALIKETAVAVSPKPILELSIKPGTTLHEHIREAGAAPKDFDGLGKMANLAAILEHQFKSMYVHELREANDTRGANPFMMANQVNMAANTYMASLEKLHRMQVEVGIVEKRPEALEVNVKNSGAFQTYMGELSGDDRQTMAEFSDAFTKFVLDRKKNSGE